MNTTTKKPTKITTILKNMADAGELDYIRSSRASEEYPFYFSIEQICYADDGGRNSDPDYNCHGQIETEPVEDISNIRFSGDFETVARAISRVVKQRYPNVENVGVLVVYNPTDDEDEMESIYEPWEHAFYIDGYNVWDETQAELNLYVTLKKNGVIK